VKRLFCVAIIVCACQSDEKTAKQAVPAAAADKAYAEDIQRICDSMSLSGADKLERGERVGPHSKWLGENVKSKEAQKFLISTQPLAGEAKASAFEVEAKRVGLPGCALADEFR
jgi:hypothetical protein